jgi:tetratricopeptide (TPR) repeat protein
MKTKLIISVFFICFWCLKIATIKAQNNDTCYKASLNYLFCMSKMYCSANETTEYHLNLINKYEKLIENNGLQITGDVYNELGKEYYQIKEFDIALKYYNLANKYTDSFGVYSNNIGTVYFAKGEYTKALSYFKKSYAILDTEQDYINNIAAVYGSQANYNTCIIWFKKSLAIGTNKNANTLALKGLITTYKSLNDNTKVKLYTKKLEEELIKEYPKKTNEHCNCNEPLCLDNE